MWPAGPWDTIGKTHARIKPRFEDADLPAPLAGPNKAAWLYGRAAAVALLDQATKHLIRERLAIAQDWPVFPGFAITHVTNQGGALSLLHGHVEILAAVSIAVIIGLVIYERRQKSLPRWQAAALGILLGGTVGNLVDRLVFGRVTDFLDVFVGEWHFPTFNVADIAINAGVAILAYQTFLAPPASQDPDSQEDTPR